MQSSDHFAGIPYALVNMQHGGAKNFGWASGGSSILSGWLDCFGKKISHESWYINCRNMFLIRPFIHYKSESISIINLCRQTLEVLTDRPTNQRGAIGKFQ